MTIVLENGLKANLNVRTAVLMLNNFSLIDKMKNGELYL